MDIIIQSINFLYRWLIILPLGIVFYVGLIILFPIIFVFACLEDDRHAINDSLHETYVEAPCCYWRWAVLGE